MADVNAVDLTQETLATLDGTEQIIMFDTAEGKRATVSAVGDYILKKLATLDSQTAQTVINNLKSRVSTLEGHNAFAEVMIGNSQIKADSAEDYLTFEAGTGITLTPDVTNDKVTIGTSLTKSNVGLGNVDNTADAVKEVAYADDAGTVNEHTVLTDVPANAVFTDTTYDDVIGDTPMGTTATTLTGAIAEHSQGLSDLTSNINPIEYTGYSFAVYSATDKGLSYVYILGKLCVFSLAFTYTSNYTPDQTQAFVYEMPEPVHDSYLQGLVFNGANVEPFRCRVYASNNKGIISNYYSGMKTYANTPAIITGAYIIK